MGTSTTARVVAANVRAELARRGRSATNLAASIGMSQSAMARRLAGQIAFDVNDLGAVATELDVPLSVLLPRVEAAA